METKNFDFTNITKTVKFFADKSGYFGKFGGSFIPEPLKERFAKLTEEFFKAVDDENFNKEFISLLKNYVGRPSPLYYARRLSEYVGSKIYLKREDLNHTGAHKINNTIGQILLAKKMGYKEIIAETGAGQHGVATATASALMGMNCKIFMGKKDYERQYLNVRRMELLGAEVIPVTEGNKSLKDAVDFALGYFTEHKESYYLIGSAVGPHPFPSMVRYFQSVIGSEAKAQILEKENSLPDYVVAAIGGGSNAIGIFAAFLQDNKVKLLAGEGAGLGINSGKTAATLTIGKEMILQGAYTLGLADEQGNVVPSYSIAAGLDYPGIGPEHAYLKQSGRVQYLPITDNQAKEAFYLLARLEGIIPAMESSHAIALVINELKNKDALVIVNISGRGDKDVERKL